MTIPLTGTGGHFTRVGKVGKALNNLNTYRGNPGTAGTDWQAIYAQFATSDQEVVSTLWGELPKLASATVPTATFLQLLAQNTTIAMVKDDVNPDDTSLFAAVEELVRQMLVSSDKVAQPTMSISITTGNGVNANHGDGVCIATLFDEDGVQMDYAFDEVIVGQCTNDSQVLTGPATLGKEPFTFEGTAPTSSSALDADWPKGSDSIQDLEAVTADDDGSETDNLFTNGDFESWNVNTPDAWTIDLGASTITEGSGYRGSGSLKITGDGTTLTALRQTFSPGGTTTAQLGPRTIHGFNFWTKVDSGMAAGVAELAIVDGGGTILQDAAGNDLKVTLTLSALTTGWVAHSAFFRTPISLPANTPYAFRIRLTTAATSGKAWYLDDLVLAPATRLYNGGPFVKVFSGATKFVIGDQFNVTVSNDYSSKWQLAAERLFGMRDLGLILPSTAASGSVTIPDSLLN